MHGPVDHDAGEHQPVTHEAIMDRLMRGEDRFARIEGQQARIIELLEPIPQMKADIVSARDISADVKEIVSAWATVKNMGRFAKWVGPVAVMFAAIVLWGRMALAAIARALN